MAIPRHLHTPDFSPPVREAHLRTAVSPEPASRAPVWIAAALLAALVVAVLVRPVHIVVGDRAAVVSRRSTIAAAAERFGWRRQAGNLVSVTGEVLRTGGGRAATLLRNGKPVAEETRLRDGDSLAWLAAADVVEPVRERAQLVPSAAVAGLAEAAVPGVRRTRLGLVSGTMLVETSYAVATAAAPAVQKKPRVVALTFDDGPWPAQTSQILAILRKHNAHATFFVLGNLARAHPAIVRQIVAEGNEVGAHSWNHENLARLSGAAVSANLARTQAQLQPLVGKPVRLMRPPYGALSSAASRAIKQDGYRIVLWSLDTNDWRRPGANAIYSRIMRAGSKSIVLCHDGGGSRRGTIEAVARAVPALQERGYQLVTVSQVLGLQALPQGGTLVADSHPYGVRTVEPGLAVTLDGEPLPLPEAPVEVGDQLAVPIRPLLDRLGLRWQWDQKAQKLTVQGAMEKVTLRLNSCQLEHEFGSPEKLPAPPVLYRGSLMVPLWVMLQTSGATALYDSTQHLLQLTSLDKGLESGKLGQGVPPDWGRNVKWREWLKTGDRGQ